MSLSRTPVQTPLETRVQFPAGEINHSLNFWFCGPCFLGQDLVKLCCCFVLLGQLQEKRGGDEDGNWNKMRKWTVFRYLSRQIKSSNERSGSSMLFWSGSVDFGDTVLFLTSCKDEQTQFSFGYFALQNALSALKQSRRVPATQPHFPPHFHLVPLSIRRAEK